MEKIERAAIHYEMSYSLEDKSSRHGDIIRFLDSLGLGTVAKQGIQGFMTSEGRFVDRQEAQKIAIAAGQMLTTPHPSGDLFTEDVW